MSGFDSDRIAALAARLGVPPHAVLVLAARHAGNAPPLDAARLLAECRRMREADAAVRAAAGLVRLGPGAFARDDADRMLAQQWSATPSGGP